MKKLRRLTRSLKKRSAGRPRVWIIELAYVIDRSSRDRDWISLAGEPINLVWPSVFLATWRASRPSARNEQELYLIRRQGHDGVTG